MHDDSPGGPPAAPGPDLDVGPIGKADARRPPAWRVWAAALTMGALAGLASWYVGEQYVEFYRPKTRQVQGMGGPMTIVTPQERAATIANNATVAFGILGGFLGLALGGAGGLLRGSPRRAAAAGVLGLALGAGAGVAASLIVLPIYNKSMETADETNMGDMLGPLLTHSAIWSAIGAACGLAFGIGLGGGALTIRSVLAGLIGGALGAAVYEMVGAFEFPLDATLQPLSNSWQTRLLGRAAVALLVAAGCAAAYAEPRRRTRPEPSP
jgi:hypothetical protein